MVPRYRLRRDRALVCRYRGCLPSSVLQPRSTAWLARGSLPQPSRRAHPAYIPAPVHLVAGEFQYDRTGLSCGSKTQRAPIDGDLPRADSEQPAEIDDDRVDLTVEQ
jgi:hypothetical protein